MEVNSQLRRRLLCLFRRPEGEVPAAWLSASAEQQRDHIGFRIKIAIETAAAVAAAIAAKQASAVRYSLTIVLTGARSGKVLATHRRAGRVAHLGHGGDGAGCARGYAQCLKKRAQNCHRQNFVAGLGALVEACRQRRLPRKAA